MGTRTEVTKQLRQGRVAALIFSIFAARGRVCSPSPLDLVAARTRANFASRPEIRPRAFTRHVPYLRAGTRFYPSLLGGRKTRKMLILRSSKQASLGKRNGGRCSRQSRTRFSRTALVVPFYSIFPAPPRVSCRENFPRINAAFK